jgi:non-heme chloroperoxidase
MAYLTTTATPTELFYEDLGSGQPVVLVHGWPLSGRMWEGQVSALLDAGHRTITYDRRGFGQSGRPVAGYDYDTFASDLNDLVTTHALRKIGLVGFSMGGGEVARYVGRYGASRVAKVAFLGAVPPFLLKTPDNPDGAPGELFDGMVAGVKKDRVNFLAQFFPHFFNRDRDKSKVSDAVLAWANSVAWAASPIGTAECINAFGRTDFRQDLTKVTMPTLVVHGDADQIVPFEGSGKKTAAAIKGSRLEVLKQAPHGFTATHGDELNAILLDFLKG